jgi:hypothetical protein
MFIPREAMPCNQKPWVQQPLRIKLAYQPPNGKRDITTEMPASISDRSTNTLTTAVEFANYLYDNGAWEYVENFTLQLCARSGFTVTPEYNGDISHRAKQLFVGTIKLK